MRCAPEMRSFETVQNLTNNVNPIIRRDSEFYKASQRIAK